MVTAQQLWKREYSNARYERWPNNVDPVDMAAFRLREKLFHFFGPAFGRTFSAPFDRNVAAAAVPWWLAGGAPTPIAVYQPKGAASLATSYVNLVNPGTYDAAPGTAPTLDASGWVFNGWSQYLTTGIVPVKQTTAMVIRFSDVLDSDMLIGAATTGTFLPTYAIRPAYVVGPSVAVYSGSSAVTAPALLSGTYGIAENKGYRNGVSEATISTYAGVIDSDIYIGAINYGGAGYFCSAKVQAVAIWNTSTGHATWMPAVMAACALI